MPLSKFIYTGPDMNIKFLGKTKDGRSRYEFIDKHTGVSVKRTISKDSLRAMEEIMQRYDKTLKRLADS